MEFLFALAECVKVRDEQLAKLVLYLARHEGRHRARLCGRFSSSTGAGGQQGREFVCRFRVGSGRRGRGGRREVERSEVFGESDGERCDEREGFLVPRELFQPVGVSVSLAHGTARGGSRCAKTDQISQSGPGDLSRHAAGRFLTLATATRPLFPDDADRLQLSHDAQRGPLLDDASIVLLLLDVLVGGVARRTGFEALQEEGGERRGEEFGEAVVQSDDHL